MRVQEAHGSIIEVPDKQEPTLFKERVDEIVEISPALNTSEEVLPEIETQPVSEVESPTIDLEEVVPLGEEIIVSEITSPVLEAEQLHDEKTLAAEVEKEEIPQEEVAFDPVTHASFTTDEHPETVLEEFGSPGIEELDPLEATILQYAVAAGYRLDDLSEEERAQLEKQQGKIVPDEPFQMHPIARDMEVDTRQTFSSWLGANKNYVPEEKSEELAIRALVNDFSDFDPSKNLYGEVEKPKQEFFSPTKKARESLREDDLPVSETLAKIYVMQGNYPKAIESYTQLSLKYPEKKIFFANLIAELTQKLNIK